MPLQFLTYEEIAQKDKQCSPFMTIYPNFVTYCLLKTSVQMPQKTNRKRESTHGLIQFLCNFFSVAFHVHVFLRMSHCVAKHKKSYNRVVFGSLVIWMN